MEFPHGAEEQRVVTRVIVGLIPVSHCEGIMGYWDLVEPVWEAISIYDGPDVFISQYNSAPEASRVLFAAHWCQSEVCNGGLGQFFSNSTGVLAPEAIEAFRKIGMPQIAGLIEQAVAAFGNTYPREQRKREKKLEALWKSVDGFDSLDNCFFEQINTENGGFEVAADAYAAANG